MDRTHFYLGALIWNFAHREGRGNFGLHPNSGDMTATDVEHLRRVRMIRDLLVRFPVGGVGGQGVEGNFIFDGDLNHISHSGIRITEDTLRALAHDAASYGNWWYDPAAPDGLSEHFPGRSLNPGTV